MGYPYSFINYDKEIYIFFRVTPVFQNIVFALISFLSSAGFTYYGCKLSVALKKTFVGSEEARRSKNFQTRTITGICAAFLFIRGILLILVTFFPWNIFHYAIFFLIYFIIIEILPSLLIIYILRTNIPNPTYQPIQ